MKMISLAELFLFSPVPLFSFITPTLLDIKASLIPQPLGLKIYSSTNLLAIAINQIPAARHTKKLLGLIEISTTIDNLILGKL